MQTISVENSYFSQWKVFEFDRLDILKNKLLNFEGYSWFPSSNLFTNSIPPIVVDTLDPDTVVVVVVGPLDRDDVIVVLDGNDEVGDYGIKYITQ